MAFLVASMLLDNTPGWTTGLDAPSFNHQFDRGENESILNGLEPALGVGLLSFRPLGRS